MSDKSTVTDLNYYSPNFQISDEIKERIVRNYIEPSYQYDIHKLIEGKKNWKLVGQIFETMSKAFVAIGGIVSFAAGSYNNFNLSFVAGAISTISLATLSFSSFGYREQKKQGIELNNLLKKLKLDDVPINERTTEDTVQARQSTVYQSQSPYNYQSVLTQYQNVINNLDDENRILRKQLDELKIKERPYYNNLEILKKRMTELENNPIISTPSTPRDNINWIRKRIEEIEIEKEEKVEINIHPER